MRWSEAIPIINADPRGDGLFRCARTHAYETHTSAFPRRISPGLCKSFRPKRRGRRECRVLAAPAVSCAIDAQRCAHEHTGTVGAFRHSLHNGFTAYAALSPETNSSCLRHRRIDGVRAPGRARNTSADLTPATGARTTRFCRTRHACAKGLDGFGTRPPKLWEGAVRLPRTDRSRAKARPAISLAQPALPRPPHSEPNVRDDRDTSLLAGRAEESCLKSWSMVRQYNLILRPGRSSIALIFVPAGFKGHVMETISGSGDHATWLKQSVWAPTPGGVCSATLVPISEVSC